jgi:Methyltransferase domain
MEGTACLNNLATGKSFAARWADTATRCGTDQGPYMRHFWDHLNHLQTTAFTMLEIGVYRGGSLATWKELFPKAKIYALDINPECAQYADRSRVKITIGSQNDPVALEEWTKQVSDPIDVIIDDGSHVMEHLKTSFMHLFPKLRPGGIYVLEDLGTCYMPEYGGRLPKPSTRIELLKSFAGLPKPSTMIELLKSFIDNINESWSSVGNPLAIDQMHFYPNICFVYKK